MKVTEILKQSDKVLFSYELVPPVRGGTIDTTYKLLDTLMKYDPPFIDLTSRSAEVSYEEQQDGTLKRNVRRKRPGTIGLSAAIKNKYGVETVPHLLCKGYTKEETEDALIELNYLGIANVLAIRGDEYRKPNPDKDFNDYASDLVHQIERMNRGKYIEAYASASSTDFCIGVGGYPEKHFQAPNMDMDIHHLKLKVEAGAEYIVTQMFFDNQKYFKFVNLCREAGITVPIIPGINVISSAYSLNRIPMNFHCEIPFDAFGMGEEALIPKKGVAWAIKQCKELIEFGVPCYIFM